MKKIILLTGALTLVASVAMANPPKAAKAPTSIKCVVMPDHSVNIKDAMGKKMFSDYKGRRYFFCCAGCPDAFKKDPAKFAKGPSIPLPKKGKKA